MSATTGPLPDDKKLAEEQIVMKKLDSITPGEVVELDATETFLRQHNFTNEYIGELLTDTELNKKLIRKVDMILLPMLMAHTCFNTSIRMHHSNNNSTMATLSSGSGQVTPRDDRRAVRIRTNCTTTIQLPDGSSRNVTVQAGTNGYLVQDRGDNYVVQLFNEQGQAALSLVPRGFVELGALHSQLSIQQPNVRHTPSIGTIADQRASDPAGKAIRFMWDGIQQNLDVLVSLGLKSQIFHSILNDPAKKREALEILIASFSSEAWRTLNTPSLPVGAFSNLPRITDDSKIEENQTMIYLRLYIGDD
ncbi:allantoate permease [Fusarium acutatum]|uniref:Allantoate permease n=1 Tax=Fusarium acutatum TaxID=78861 RepID=A0A8H4JJK1_9HYPO|nr:allantoate permease [Fusarium acutatum]